MNIQVEDLAPCKKLIKVSVPANEMEEDAIKVRNAIQQKANIPGFRIGKAPLHLLEKYYGDVIQNELINQVINTSYKKALEEKGLHPIKQVTVDKVDFKKGEKLDFQFELEVAPVFDLPNYINIPIEKKKYEVNQEHVDAEIKYLLERSAYFEPITDRGIMMDDYVVVDYAIKQKEEILDEAKQIWIEVREDFFIPKFCDELVGLKKGEEKEMKIVLPKDYAKPELSGKKVNIKVKVNELKKKVLPELTDEFAKQLGNFGSVNELKQKIKDDLLSYFEQMSERDTVSQVENYLLKNTKIDVPESMVDSFQGVLYEDTVSYLKSSGKATDEIIKEKETDLKESTRRDAIAQVKLIYILDSIAAKENIDVTDDEVNNRIEMTAKKSGKKDSEVREYLDKNDKWWDFKYRLRNEKLTKYLIEKAKVTEKEVKNPDKAAKGA